MDKLFLSILNMSLTGAFVITAICIARLPLKKAPKIISYALWAVAGFRLVFPFSIESIFSLIPFKAQTIQPDIAVQTVPRIDSGIPFVNNAVSGILPAATPTASANPLQVWMVIGAYVWLAGVAVMLVYGVASFIILKRKMRGAVHIEANIYEAENIKSPFVLGVFTPRIYLPVGLSEHERGYILLHEQTHIRRCDHIVKFAAYFVLCLHWLNPLAWVAFPLMGADMEMSCDERVIKELGGGISDDYSMSLVRIATGRRILNGSPLAFGEGGMKERVKRVLNFKKPSRIIIVAAVALVVVLSVGFAVNRVVSEPLPWEGIVQNSDSSYLDMRFARIRFGSDREHVVGRLGEPGTETISPDGSSVLSYYFPPAMYAESDEFEPVELPGTDVYVTFYLDSPECIEKKGLTGVWRIDVEGDSEMMRLRYEVDETLAGILALYGGPNAVERDGDSYILWYYKPEDTDKRLWIEVKDGELTRRHGMVCVCDGDSISASEAVEQFISNLSVSREYEQIFFQIPAYYYKPYEWNIHISGRIESDDGFGMSVHYFDDVNELHAWAAGEAYSFPFEYYIFSELVMDISLSDDNGNIIEKNIDLLAVALSESFSN